MKEHHKDRERLAFRILLTVVALIIFLFLLASGPALAAEEPSCEAARPQMMVDYRLTYWASLPDYLNRRLTVDTWLKNDGATDAFAVAVIDSVPGGGVQRLSPVPVILGDVGAGQRSVPYRLVYEVPLLATTFETWQPVIALDGCGEKYEYSFVTQNEAAIFPDRVI